MGAYSIKIESGVYTGAGVAQLVAACDGPDFVITKRITGSVTAAHIMWKRMLRNRCAVLGGAASAKANQITDLTKDGFWVGSGQAQNSAPYAYLCIKANGGGAKYFQTGRYYGNATDNRDLTGFEGCPFTPDFVGLHRDTDGYPGAFRTSQHVGDSAQVYAGVSSVNYIQAFSSTGFQLGTNANVNAADYYNWFALRAIPGGLAVGSFTGTGAAQAINVGFAPDCVLIKTLDTVDSMVMLTTGMVSAGSASHPFSAAAADAQAISGLTSSGFTVGTADAANKAGSTLIWMALKNGEYSPGGSR